MAVTNGPSDEDYENARRLVRIGEDMDEREHRIRLAAHAVIVREGRMRCSCGARFVAPTPEQRATDFLEHRRNPEQMGMNIEWPLKALGVPDDAPLPGIVTIAYVGMVDEYNDVFDDALSMTWNHGAVVIEHKDGKTTIIPGGVVRRATYEEA